MSGWLEVPSVEMPASNQAVTPASIVGLWPTAAPDVCDGTSAAGESRHRIPRRLRWSTD